MRKRGLTRLVVTVALAASGLVLATLVWDARHGEEAGAVDLPPVAEQMSAFASTPVALADVPTIVRRAEGWLPAQSAHGSAIPGQVRRLGRNLGRNDVSAFAFPTDGGAVCVLLAEATHAATCIDSFEPESGNVRPMIYSGEKTPQTITGLASDTVANIRVVVEGSTEEATLAHNLFFWQSRDGALPREAVKALLVTQDDGTEVRINLDFSAANLGS